MAFLFVFGNEQITDSRLRSFVAFGNDGDFQNPPKLKQTKVTHQLNQNLTVIPEPRDEVFGIS
ncbi:hypothetical protein CWN95_16780 [Vibrio splendidus]|nr:hypothetical protein A6D94_11060 [Vibrio splendidus]OED79649.1 hypothetical protein A144_00640 [Vibrio splendidus ZF-90]PMG23634.1 hypothetical protein BCU95_14645 [Vibrio splendidus]PTP33308.1 hypothetical protein CWN95_16780 [Vibrio splendidus]